MITASLILIMSVALFFFYFQVTCQKVLRREFAHNYFQSVVNVNRLAFPALRNSAENSTNFASLRTALACDFSALTYLLKHANNVSRGYGLEERLLMVYFRLIFFCLTLRHLLRLREKPAILKLTAVLQYFSNVVGQRIGELRLGNLAASDYLLNI